MSANHPLPPGSMVGAVQPARPIIAAARAAAAKQRERLTRMVSELELGDALYPKVANSQNSSQQPDNSLSAKKQQPEK